jgi:hypothetical protein
MGRNEQGSTGGNEMKKQITLLLALLLALLPCAANATQSNLAAGNFPTVSPYSGLSLVNNLNTAMAAIISQNAGASAPSYATSDMFWPDTTHNLLDWTPNGTNFYPMGAFGNSTWEAISDGAPDDAVTATGSSNAYVVTYSPAVTTLFTGHIYKFITNFAVTGSATVNFGPGAITLKKQGATNLASGDLGSGVGVTCMYDGTNCEITSQLSSSASGGVTSVATSGQVCGGTITTTGTISLCTQGNNTVIGNISGSTAAPSPTAVPVVTSWGVGTTSSATGNELFSPSTNALALSTSGAVGLEQYSDQGVTVGSPTGGDQGSGSINAAALYVNGVAVATGTANGLTGVHTINASAASSVVFNSTYVTTTYDKFVLEFDGVYTSDGGALAVVVSANNGSSYLTSNFYYSGGPSGCITSNTYWEITSTSNSANQPAIGTIKFLGPSSANIQPAMEWRAGWANGTAPAVFDCVGTVQNGGTFYTINNIKLYDVSGGNITGNFHLYGLAN